MMRCIRVLTVESRLQADMTQVYSPQSSSHGGHDRYTWRRVHKLW